MANMFYKVLLAVVAVTAVAQLTVATNYTVGAPNGSWDLTTNYTQWVASKTFHTGDVLIFTYSSSAHDVLEVTKSNYDSCSTTSPIFTDTSGNTVVPLTTVGTRYFICGFPTHCTNGMKVQIDISSSSTSPAPSSGGPTPPSPSPSVPSVPSTPASPSPAGTSPPGTSSPGSAAGRVAVGAGLGLSLIAGLLVL